MQRATHPHSGIKRSAVNGGLVLIGQALDARVTAQVAQHASCVLRVIIRLCGNAGLRDIVGVASVAGANNVAWQDHAPKM